MGAMAYLLQSNIRQLTVCQLIKKICISVLYVYSDYKAGPQWGKCEIASPPKFPKTCLVVWYNKLQSLRPLP